MQIVIISGLSGAGKSHAIDFLEDMGFYCIDNLPPPLIDGFLSLVKNDKHKINKVSFVIDIRGGVFLEEFVQYLEELNDNNVEYKLIFLETRKAELLKRYAETRRTHPLAIGNTNAEAIEEEIERLAEVKNLAHCVIDTSDMKSAELALAIKDFIFAKDEKTPYHILIQSFGYKYGMPAEADYILDMRFIPNPFYVDELRALTGNDKAVQDYVMSFEISQFFAKEIIMLIETLKPSFIRERKSNLSIAFGCTGGQHRSVTFANYVYNHLKNSGESVTLRHREL